jgi:hypothetical protein
MIENTCRQVQLDTITTRAWSTRRVFFSSLMIHWIVEAAVAFPIEGRYGHVTHDDARSFIQNAELHD